MEKIQFIFPLLLLISSLLPAQEVAISYDIVPSSDDHATMQLYIQSLTDQDQTIRAINFSLALPEGCAKITGQKAIFSDTWTDYLQEVQMSDQLDLTYHNWNYSHRWQYGSADPGLPHTTAILAPAQGNSPLLIMEIELEGNCIDKVYLEQQTENPVNQMGDDNVLPINWTVIHPKTELSLQSGLKLNIYPNPVMDYLRISVEGEMDTDFEVSLTSLDGKMLGEKVLMSTNRYDFSFNMTKLPAAVYILSVKNQATDTQLETIKIIKQ